MPFSYQTFSDDPIEHTGDRIIIHRITDSLLADVLKEALDLLCCSLRADLVIKGSQED
jgi:hypothetical protein